MKKTIYLIATLFAFFAINISGTFAQETKAEGFKTDSIKTSAECDMCKTAIEKAVNKLIGIKSCNLDVESKVLAVTYDEDKVTISKIRKAINKAGYDADNEPSDPRAYAKLPSCCKKGGHKE
jgi:periplasmic mercuric ion binding protein